MVGSNYVELTNEIESTYASIARLNPFRYRGYYFDIETGLYYLNSRYYDPELGRFINADDISILNNGQDYLNGLNLYAYCFNNPINDSDNNGNWSWGKFFGWVAVVAVTVTAVVVTAVTLGAAAPVAGMVTAAAVGSAIGMTTSLVSQAVENGMENVNPWQVVFNGILGGATGLLMASPLGWGTTGILTGGLGAIGSIGNDLLENKNANIGKALTIGVLSGLITGGGKYLATGGKLINIPKTEKTIFQAKDLLQRQFVNLMTDKQILQITMITKLLRSLSIFTINKIWN